MGMGNESFYQTASLITDGGIPLVKFKSAKSGLNVCIAQAEGPLVAGYMCLATEAHDDDGLPHTLEHLIFLGSAKYPYKGVLDLISNRCLASGTNAWTDTDHTSYTMTTAGHEGFLCLLPIYVDHLLYPTLTDAAFTTEVHHINSEGEDAGIVYCEMQGRENSAESRCHLSMLRAMYPGDCGYKSETAGMLKNLRESTNNEKVHSYHKAFYRPENLSIIIVGQIEAKDVFEALCPIEDQISKESTKGPFVRPWQSPVPPLLESVTLDVKYPCDEDEFGIVIAAWRGPEAKDYTQLISAEIFLEYLTDTSISPLQRDLVECTDPICSHIEYTVVENSVSCICLYFSNVPVSKMNAVKPRLFSVLEKIASGAEAIDMDRMKTVILKKKLYILSRVESDPHTQLAMCLIGDILYGNSIEDLQHRVQQIPIIESFLDKDDVFWRSLLKSYMVEGKYVLTLGHPSPSLAKEMALEEKLRIEEQRKQLGPEGLKCKGEILKEAVAANEVLPPANVINSIPLPSLESIKFHRIQRSSNCSENCDNIKEFPLSEMPCRFQLDNVRSNFVRMYALLDTVDLSEDLRMFLPLFVELIIESSVSRNGVLIPHQEVVKELAKDTVSVSVSIGLSYRRFWCEEYAQVLCLHLMVEETQYEKGVQWIREILYQTVFEPSRIKTIASKMVTDVARIKRQGNKIANLLITNLCYLPESNRHAAGMMRQQSFLNKLLKTLETQPEVIVKALNDVRERITKMDKLTIHLGADFSSLRMKSVLEEPWKTNFTSLDMKPAIMKKPIKQCHEFISSFSDESVRGTIIGVSSVESSFLFASAPCINSYSHPDYPALLVLIQYLTQTEGPLWKQIRGLGLAYHYSIFVRPNEGLIYFHLFKSSHIVSAYKEGEKIVESHLNNETPWDTALLESACGSLIYAIISREKNVSDVVMQSLAAYYKNVDLSFTKALLEKVSKVTFADMERVGNIYLKPLFNPQLSKCGVCCHSSKVDEVVAGFKQMSRELAVLPSLENSVLTGC